MNEKYLALVVVAMAGGVATYNLVETSDTAKSVQSPGMASMSEDEKTAAMSPDQAISFRGLPSPEKQAELHPGMRASAFDPRAKVMRALCVKGGVVVTSIVVESIEAFKADSPGLFASFDAVIDGGDGLNPEPGAPGPGWTFDGKTFTAPAPSPEK